MDANNIQCGIVPPAGISKSVIPFPFEKVASKKKGGIVGGRRNKKKMPCLYKRYKNGRELPNWYIRYYDEFGNQTRMCTGTPDDEAAEALLAQIRADMWNGKWFPEKVRNTKANFGDLWTRCEEDGYATERDFSSIKHLLPVFGNRMVTEITEKMARNYIKNRLDEGAAHSTVEKEFALGRKMYNLALSKKGWKQEFGISDNPWTEAGFPGYDNERCRILTVEEEKKLLEHASPAYLEDAIIFAIHTGCRRKEILWLKWSGVNFELRNIRVRISKRKNQDKPRYKVIPMSNRCYEMLLRRRQLLGDVVDPNTLVFPVAVEALKDSFERAVKSAKLVDLRLHDLRHTCISRWAMLGIPEGKIVAMAGWTTSAMFQRYAHFVPGSLQEAADAADRFYEMSFGNTGFGDTISTRQEVELVEMVKN